MNDHKSWRSGLNLILFFSLTLLLASCSEKELKYTKYVDPFIGTGGQGWSEGRCFPGPTLPYGMVQLAPENRDDSHTGYYRYNSKTIKGFSHTHLSGGGVSEAADITCAPTVGKPYFTPGVNDDDKASYRSAYKKDTEYARPGYYSVFLDDYQIKAELTATMRTGMHRYTFPETAEANIILDLHYGVRGEWVIDSWLKVIDDRTIGGFRQSHRLADDQHQFFVARFSQPFDSVAIVRDSVVTWHATEAQGFSLQAITRFNTTDDKEILVKVGLSSASMEGAMANLKSENPGWNFDKIARKAEETWDKELAKVEIEDGNDENKTIFYTGLYHSFLGPTVYSDVDGSYRGHDKQVHKVEEGDHYTLFSLWDTYRALHPLMTILQTRRTNDVINSFLRIYDQHGRLPVWDVYASETGFMIGYHAVSVMADAYAKGIRGFDLNKALEASRTMAEGRDLNVDYHTTLGYIPYNTTRWCVSKTLEYAYDDYCIALLADAAGDKATYGNYIKRAQFYKNIFDHSTGFFVGRHTSGKFKENFNPNGWYIDYCEAGAYQYKFYVPQDMTNMIGLFGGNESFVAALDTLFARGQYAHDNEPSHHMPFLYNYAGAAWKTQERVRNILDRYYDTTPEGLCGNDDVGQMSAWYVLGALGLYQVCPGVPDYALTSPLFDKAVLNLENGNKFTIRTVNNSPENVYIRNATLNGQPYGKSYLTHEDIVRGGEIVLELSDTPDKSWAAGAGQSPVTHIRETAAATPIVITDKDVIGPRKITIESEPDATVYYTTDGSEPTVASTRYSGPFELKASARIKALATVPGLEDSYVSVTPVTVKDSKYPTIVSNAPIHHYEPSAPEGATALIDGLSGTSYDGVSGYWLFFEGKNPLDVVIDLGEVKPIKSISANFLLAARSSVFGPSKVEYMVSSDNKDFKTVGEYSYKHSQSADYMNSIKTYTANLTDTEARYIKVVAVGTGKCPPWHMGWANCCMCVDEITIE